MGFGKRPINDKLPEIGSSRPGNGTGSRKPGCPIPLSTGCLRGPPIPRRQNEGGVQMLCTNADCPFKDLLVHRECFDALETNLIKIMSNIGSARGWTEAQRKANLWDKKGLTLIQKKCRCPCGLGLLRLDENAIFMTKRSEPTPVMGRQETGKKCKSKNLPKLNFGCRHHMGSLGYINRHYNKYDRKKQASPRGVASSSSNTSIADTVLLGHNWEYSWSPDGDWMHKSDLDISRNRTKCREGWTKHPSAAPTPLQTTVLPSDSSGAFKWKRVDGSISYAEATSIKPHTKTTQVHISDLHSNGTSTRTSTKLDTNNADFSLFGANSCSGDYSIFSNDMAALRIRQAVHGCIHGTDQVASLLPTPPETISSNNSNLSEDVHDLNDETEDGFDGYYHLFKGPTFGLAEIIIAESYLPGILY